MDWVVGKTLSVTVIAFLFLLPADAQSIRRPVASGYIGHSAYSTQQADAFSFTANQACLIQIKKLTGGIYSERRYLLNELTLYNAAVVLPTQTGNFGVSAAYYGFRSYNETQAALAYGRKLGDNIAIGVQFNYYAVKIQGYGKASAPGFEGGILWRLTDQVNAGIHIANPVGGKFGNDAGEKLPFIYTIGMGYDAADKFFISIELEKEEDRALNVMTALQYVFTPRLLASTGISTATSNWWLGIGVVIKSLRIDVTASYHPQLGITPGLLLLINTLPPHKHGEVNQ